jgi:hypothetical protein
MPFPAHRDGLQQASSPKAQNSEGLIGNQESPATQGAKYPDKNPLLSVVAKNHFGVATTGSLFTTQKMGFPISIHSERDDAFHREAFYSSFAARIQVFPGGNPDPFSKPFEKSGFQAQPQSTGE